MSVPGVFLSLAAQCQRNGLGSISVKASSGSGNHHAPALTSRHGLVGVGVSNSTLSINCVTDLGCDLGGNCFTSRLLSQRKKKL